MDEQEARLAAAFRAAAGDMPPPGFDAADVVATSRRITRRRRSALAGGALAVLAVAGVGLAAGLSGGTRSELTTASAAGAPGAAQEKAQDAAPEAAPPIDAAGVGSGSGGAGASGEAASAAAAPVPVGADPAMGRAATAPLGPGTGGCANRQDPALRALVDQALPEVAGAPEAMTTQECRPGGERGVALQVRDGATAGLFSVTYLPPGEPVDPPGIAEAPAVVRTAPTASGGTVVASSRAERAGATSPFAGRLDGLVAYLAPRL